ncbi:MAG: mechanosensitive ion channel [Thermoplasmata archaeon]|nr:mechanosensitive ion channel [Thermoplasmata archaeon]
MRLGDPIIFNISLLDFIFFLLVLGIGLIVARIVAGSVKNHLIKMKVGELLAEFTGRILRIILYVFVIGIAISFLGVNVGAALISISVVMGFVLGFALGDTLSNFAAGFMVAITKPFKVGDYVDVAGQSGSVVSVGISITELNTPDNKHIIIPNKAVWGGSIVNYTHHKTRRVDMTTGVSYEDDLDLALKTTMDIVAAHPKVLKTPEPQIVIAEMADSSVNLIIRPWANTSDYWDVFFDLQKSLKEGYDKAGLSIPYPQTDVHMIQKVDK